MLLLRPLVRLQWPLGVRAEKEYYESKRYMFLDFMAGSYASDLAFLCSDIVLDNPAASRQRPST